MGGAQGLEWDFVEELVHGKHTSYAQCKSCGHEFHESATRIKEHLFNAGINVIACIGPPSNLSTRLYKYASKLRAKVALMSTKPTMKCNAQVSQEKMGQPSNLSLNDENVHTFEIDECLLP